MEKTLGRLYRETIKKELKKNIKDKPNFFIAHYKGLKAPELNQLRKELDKIDVNMCVVRNRLTRSVLEDLQLNDLLTTLDGPTAFIFSSGDPISVSKSLINFSKEHENLKIDFALIDKRLINKSEVKTLAFLPPREVLLAMVVGGIKAPLSSLAFVLAHTLRKFVFVLDAVSKNKKDQPAQDQDNKEHTQDIPKQQ